MQKEEIKIKYKRSRHSHKYVSEFDQNTSPVKKSNLKKRSVIAAAITLTLFCASRIQPAGIEIIKNSIFIKGENSFVRIAEEKLPFLNKFGEMASRFCFGYLKDEPESKAVFANDSKIPDENKIEDMSVDSATASDALQPQPREPIFEPIFPCIGSISSSFGKRTHPLSGQGSFHNGIDIAANIGADVNATESGTVTKSVYDQFSGNLIIISHIDGYTSSYAHLSQSFVTSGQTVKKGDRIGLVGSTGISTGPHLHIEIRKNGEPVDPNSFYNVS